MTQDKAGLWGHGAGTPLGLARLPEAGPGFRSWPCCVVLRGLEAGFPAGKKVAVPAHCGDWQPGDTAVHSRPPSGTHVPAALEP